MIKVYINSEETWARLNELRNRMGDITPAMDAVGKILVAGTQQRFVDQCDPSGDPWARLSPITLARRRKGGGGAQILRDTGRLASSIQYSLDGGALQVFSPEVYASTHQRGARKGQYGRTRRGAPIPWGNVPQRAFLGLSEDDQAEINELLDRYLDVSRPASWWRSLLNGLRRLF